MNGGLAGRLAGAFLESKLTPLLIVGAVGLGAYTLSTMASEEEPQIIVPLADLYLPLPGATPEEVENRVLIPLENVLSGIGGVEYVYSHAESGFGLATVRFEVGLDMEESLTQLYSTLLTNIDRMPQGLAFPLVKAVTIDDVPFFAFTLFSESEDGGTLRSLADEIRVELEGIPDVRDVAVVGGYPREIRVELLPDRLAAFGIDPGMVSERLQMANVQLDVGSLVRRGADVRVKAGPFLTSAEDVAQVVLDVRDGRLVQIGDVARVVDGPAEVDSYTFHLGAGSGWQPMVGIAVAKRPGADATGVGRALEDRIEALAAELLPEGVDYLITRNYGETAREKVTTLKEHLGLAIIAVGLVILLTMGWRTALVVMMAVPVTFALTLFVYQLFDYTLNRVTLFALIFVTGIVIDDSIIIVENMERHFSMRDRPLAKAARDAVNEVGNPTILATLTVIAAVLPMLFVSGLMGPYMSPMPIGATLAMLFSLAVALIITPWLALRLLGGTHARAHGNEHKKYVLEETRLYRFYGATMGPMLRRPVWMWTTLGVVGVMLIAAVGLFLMRVVPLKMLPFDDKSEVQLILDMPEGVPLESTVALASDIGRALIEMAEVESVQLYAGVAAPFNFNGMIRHYYLRNSANMADLQVNLLSKHERDRQSHDIALEVRTRIAPIVAASGRTGVSAKVVEVPPGPPVLSTLVAEIYGPDDAERERVAALVMDRFVDLPMAVDVDWSLHGPQEEVAFVIDEERAALSGVLKPSVVRALGTGLAGEVATHISVPSARESVPVRVRLAEEARSGVDRLGGLHVRSISGEVVPLSELVNVVSGAVPQVIDRKNGRRVVYVMAEVAGGSESPAYAILDLKDEMAQIELSTGDRLGQLYRGQPRAVEQPVLKWDGEWQITYEVFRDLGIAFAGALVLIYILIVAWFGSFATPAAMMAAIPLTLVGIAPGHLMFGAFFTATSMIGMIALAGIMVRNGILLIDYLEARREAGIPLEQAVIEAGAVRTRPIVLTAGTVVIGAIVILFDPIFQGLAVALITGAVASTILTLAVVPVIYFLMRSRHEGSVGAEAAPLQDPGT